MSEKNCEINNFDIDIKNIIIILVIMLRILTKIKLTRLQNSY